MSHKNPRLVLLGALALLLLLPLSAAADDFAGKIEKAHGNAWETQAAFSTDIVVNFGGNTMIDGQMITDTPAGRSRFELKDGTVLVFDGQDAWTSPEDSAFQGARFHVLTWPYFLAAPWKLDDPGTHLKDLGKQPYKNGEKLKAARLTFDSGIGDSPDDWYVVYRNDKNQLAGMAYIVTFGTDVAEAEKEPHAITYHDFKKVDGVMIPTRWEFWNWSAEKGIFGDPIGEVTLKNPRFVNTDGKTFANPGNSRREDAPGR